jgi:hypothetical protein
MTKRLLFPMILAAASLVPAASAMAATQETASENWAGYVATPTSASGFSAVSGAWTQPAVTCTSGESDSYSSFWVGLGGGEQQSSALEQIGTQGDCSADGTVSYYAWYELVPAGPVKLKLSINAGDKVYARTAVSGDKVTLELVDHTSGQSWTKTLTMTDATPDTATAEWVAEAPSACVNGTSGQCTPLPLADFNTATFIDAHATAGGHTGSVSDSHWTNTAIELMPSTSSPLGGGSGGYGQFSGYGGYGASDSSYSEGSSSGAAPGSLSGDGTSFTVKYGASLNLGSSASSQTQGSGSGEGTGDGYGDSGYPSGGYSYQGGGYGGYGGYGYPSGGWGDSGYGGYGSSYGSYYGY